MPIKKTRQSQALVPAITQTTGTLVPIGDGGFAVDAAWRDAAVHPRVPGPWSREADKYAWTDAETGYGCIIRRNERDGHLGGYVGVPPSHPLFGWDAAAIAGLDITVHGGVSYAEECMHWERESRSICHVVVETRPRHTMVHGRKAHDDLWWIGFECDQPYDALPIARSTARDGAAHGSATPEYRDAGYVLEQTRSLTVQLAAIAEGRPPAEAVRSQAPPAALDPVRTRSK